MAGLVGGVLASACQTHDVEPGVLLAQTTVATPPKANLMMLLDTSSSQKPLE